MCPGRVKANFIDCNQDIYLYSAYNEMDCILSLLDVTEEEAVDRQVQNRRKKSPAVAVIQGFKDLLVCSPCRRLYVGQEPCSCEQVDVGILWGTQRGAQTDWGGRGGRGYTDREVNQETWEIFIMSEAQSQVKKLRNSIDVEKRQITMEVQQCCNKCLSCRSAFTSGHHG